MSRERGARWLAAAFVLVLAGVTLAQPSSRELTSLRAPTSAASTGGERLARAVRYADVHLGSRATLRVAVEGDHGGVLLSLVDERDHVREVRVEPGDSVARFGAVDSGSYALRVLAAPPEPPATGGSITVRVATGGRPWALFALASLLVVTPPLVLAARKRSMKRDEEPTNR